MFGSCFRTLAVILVSGVWFFFFVCVCVCGFFNCDIVALLSVTCLVLCHLVLETLVRKCYEEESGVEAKKKY